MSSQVISYRLGTDEVLALREKALPGESDNQTAQRLMRESLELSTETSTASTVASPSLDDRIESIVDEKLASFAANQNDLFNRLQESIQSLQEWRQAVETQAIALPPANQVETESDPAPVVDNSVDAVDLTLTGKELAQRLKVHPATLTKNRAKETFADWTRDRDPEGKAWQYLSEAERYKPTVSTDLSTESTGEDDPSLSGWKARVDEVVNSL